MRETILYTIIGGYLGAGKTTLLNDLLHHAQGLRLAVVVNDFGDINIDADLIESHDGETIQLASGCICCSLVNGFTLLLNQLSKRAGEIDHIIVEASGLADPVKAGQYGAILDLELDGVIVLADAEQVREKAANKYVGETVIRQIRGADLLVLNKVDLVSTDELAGVRAWLAELAPEIRIVEATFGQVPMEVLLGAHATGPGDGDAAARERQNLPSAGGREQPDIGEIVETRSLTRREPIHEAGFRAFVGELPAGVLRAKGFVHLAEDPERRHVLQLVGKRWALEPGEPWGEAEPQTRLVFIGLPGSLDLTEIEEGA